MGHRIRPLVLTASEVVGGFSAQPASVTVHGWILSETGGTSDALLKFYIPTSPVGGAQSGQTPVLPSAAGTEIFQINVTKGTGQPPFWVSHGIFFQDGLYIAVSGGTLLGTLFVS